MPLLPGARKAPVGTPNAMTDVSNANAGMNRAGNSTTLMPALGANGIGGGPCPCAGAAGGADMRSGSPNDTKWFFQATSLPLASTAPFK